MGNYRLTEDAKEDLRRIYRYGVINFGEAQADLYYDTLISHFEQIADNPYLYQPVDHIRKDIGVACAELIASFIVW